MITSRLRQNAQITLGLILRITNAFVHYITRFNFSKSACILLIRSELERMKHSQNCRLSDDKSGRRRRSRKGTSNGSNYRCCRVAGFVSRGRFMQTCNAAVNGAQPSRTRSVCAIRGKQFTYTQFTTDRLILTITDLASANSEKIVFRRVGTMKSERK